MMGGQAEIIRMENLFHNFGEKEVLKGINIHINEGEIFGLLGPSGAGKTTLIRLLTGQLVPCKGQCCLFQTLSKELRDEQYLELGIMMDNCGLYERMSCRDNLKFYQMLDSGRANGKEIDELLEKVGLAEAEKCTVANLSKGMRNRLAFARAILRSPKILFLDEPTGALDPMTTAKIHELIMEEKRKGTTIFLTTHNMHEATSLCDRIALLNEGKMVEYGEPKEICRKYNHQKKVLLRLKNGEELQLAHEKESGQIIAQYMEKEEIETIHTTEPDLETVFMEITGKELDI